MMWDLTLRVIESVIVAIKIDQKNHEPIRVTAHRSDVVRNEMVEDSEPATRNRIYLYLPLSVRIKF